MNGSSAPPSPLRRLADRVPGRVRLALRALRRPRPGPPWPRHVALCALVDDRVHNAARRLQLELEARHGVSPGLLAPPHVTLKIGFEAVGPDALVSYLEELAASTEPFEVSVGDLDFFEEGVIFLSVERHPRLDALRRRVVADLAERFGVPPRPLEVGDDFRFHLTIAHGLPAAAFDEERRTLQRNRPALRFRLERLALLYAMSEGWVTGATASLGRGPPGPGIKG